MAEAAAAVKPWEKYQTDKIEATPQATPAASTDKPWAKYDPKNLPSELGRGGIADSMARSGTQTPARQTISEEVAKLRGMDPDVDYNTGGSFMNQSVLAKADNPEEAAAVMQYLYGKGNYGQDKGGRWWAKVGGKKIAIQPGFGAEIVGTAPVTAGAVGGGMAASEFGPLGMAAGAGGGAAFGKAVDEAYKAAIGAFKKTAGGEAKELAKTALWNAAFEAGGQSLGALWHGLGSAGQRFFGATPEGKAITEKVLAGTGKPGPRNAFGVQYNEGAARPPIASVAPGAKVLQYDQMLRNLLKGNPQEAKNVAYIQNEIRQMLRQEGMSEGEISTMMTEVSDTGSAISSGKAGEVAVQHASAYRTVLEEHATAAMKDAQAEIGKTDKLMRTLADTAPGDLGVTVATDIVRSRQLFGARMNAVYDHIDQMTGGAPVIPTFLLKRSIKPALDGLPPEKVPLIFQEIMKLDKAVSIKQMQRYRTRLRELADGGLTPDIDNHLFADAATAADASFDRTFLANPPDARAMLTQLKGMGIDITSNADKAVKLLRDADGMYRDGIAKYKDAAMNMLVKQARAGMPPDPGMIADTIAKVGQSKRAETIMGVLTPETRRAVAAADMKNIISDAAKATGSQGGKEIAGDSLLNVLNERGALLDTVYGPVYGKEFVGKLKEYAKQLAAIDGKVDVAALQPGKEADAIAGALFHQNAVDEFVKGNVIGVLSKGGPQQVDRAMRYLIQPGNEAKLAQAVNTFGPQSQTVKELRRYALKSLIAKAMVDMPSRVRTIGGSGIDDALSKFTPKQQELLFPDGLAEDLRNVAKEARFLFPWDTAEGGVDFGGSLAAAQIKAHVPFSVKADLSYIKRAFFGWLADRETTIRLLSTGLQKDGPAKLYAKQSLKVLFRGFLNSQIGGPGRGQPVQ